MTTRVSVAARIASSSSWRSSLRASRSPVIGSRASTSSPSTAPRRGKTPSSSPSRQTTRCGTERIGTIVQTVRVPVRKLARVGPAAEPVGQQRAHVGQPQRRRRRGRRPPRRTRPSSRCTCRACQPSLGGDRGQRARRRRRAPSSQCVERAGCRPAGRSRRAAGRRTRRAGRPGRPAPLPTSSSGSARSSQAAESSDSATPASSRSSPNSPGVRDVGREPELGAVLGVEGPADAGLARPRCRAGRGRRR